MKTLNIYRDRFSKETKRQETKKKTKVETRDGKLKLFYFLHLAPGPWPFVTNSKMEIIHNVIADARYDLLALTRQ